MLLAEGMEVREIAESLGLSPKTVHVHRANLFAKLGISNNVELAKKVLNL
ncbi:bacterial regulatory s, luxR family protein [Yersinia pestis PY-64]|nr:bacterial regulatory s, luxR family protein [Yersinia pestis PY-64]